MLRISEVSKRFGDQLANDRISIDLAPGEVLALLGENGAGKSTLVSILFGHYVADSGRIEIDGRPLPPGDTHAALDAGVGMVHQHFALAENLTVLDNIMVGQEPLWQLRSQRVRFRQRIVAAAAEYGLTLDPDALVRDLSVGERQRVEIVKALVRGARYLILDEPTAVLTPGEVDQLMVTLRGLVANGLAVIFISHKLPEVLAVSQRIVVLRAGRVVAEMASAEANIDRLAQAMIGRGISEATAALAAPPLAGGVARGHEPGGTEPGGEGEGGMDEPVLTLEGITVRHGERMLLSEVGFSTIRGEILAIAGVAGNGQQVLADLLCGMLAPDSGSILLARQLIGASPRQWIDAGVARIPEDRITQGVVGDATLLENAVVSRYREPGNSRLTWTRRWLQILNRTAMRERAAAIVQQFDVRHRGLDEPIRNLSGGNIQKFILGRELSGAPGLIIANQPTWGLDIGAVAYVHEQLRRARERGASVVLISEDLDEILALADRVAVIYRGRLSAPRQRGEWSHADIGRAMAGQTVH